MKIKVINPNDLELESICICQKHDWKTYSEGIVCRACINSIRGILFYIGRFGSYNASEYWNTRMEDIYDTISRSTYAYKQSIVEVGTTNVINALKYEIEHPERFNELINAAIERYNVMKDKDDIDNEN